MPVLENKHHERFCQLVADGWNQYEAYWEAGYKRGQKVTARVQASRLMRSPRVRDRVNELQLKRARRIELKAPDVIDMLLEDRKFAYRVGAPAAAIKAAELIGKQIGMFLDKKDPGKSGLLTYDQESFQDLERVREILIREVRVRDRSPRPKGIEGGAGQVEQDISSEEIGELLSGDGPVIEG